MSNIKECDNCKYYDDGVCCNSDSEYCADFVGFGQCCNEYEENERLTFKTELGISIDKNEDCPTMSICWNCDIPPRKCNYFNDAIEKLAKYEEIGTIEEFKDLKEKNEPKKPIRIDECTCPSCGTHNEIIKKRRNTVAFDTVYCWHCGQAIEVKRD